MRIVLSGLCYDREGPWGSAGAGKSTVVQRLSELGFLKVNLADPMKEFLQKLFGWSEETLWGSSELRKAPDPVYLDPQGNPITPRRALQTLGTEWGRNLCPDVWLQACDRALIALEPSPTVVGDARFLNELAWFREREALLVRVKRALPRSCLPGAWPTHRSETELLDVPDSYFDRVLEGHDVPSLRGATTALWDRLGRPS